MAQTPKDRRAGEAPNETRNEQIKERTPLFYCPRCAREVTDPLTCGDCSAIICRICGTPLEGADDLAFG